MKSQIICELIQTTIKSSLKILYVVVAVVALAYSLLYIQQRYPDEVGHLCDIVTALGTAISAGCAWLALSISRQLIQEKKSENAETNSSAYTTAKTAGVKPIIDPNKTANK
ncbi:hypothetical protein [Parasutterella muris]|uniref:hypothetical protein n=1 Tax=Parasutterella muris TaxID=2565572 RepID=UPI0020418C04|nr:hypothetical protein [Parasutterella muris]